MARFLRLGGRVRIVAACAMVLLLVAGAAVVLALTRHQPSPPAAGSVPAQPSPVPATTSAGASAASPPAATTPTAATSGCPAAAGKPPSGTIAANFPVALAFAPDGRLFFAERGGTIRVVEAGSPRVFATVPTVTAERDGGYSERGLLGLAVSPSFAVDHFVYAIYDLPDYTHEDVVRWTDCGAAGTAMTTLIELPAGDDCCHKGGRLVFGPDGKLYVTLGEEHAAAAAQDVHDVRGKVLRYNPDGSVPADNPFGAGNPVWAYGLRNPFGIAFSGAGVLMVTSNGPSGDAGSPGTGYDTADTITRGAGYQWPLCYGFSHAIDGNAGCAGQSGPDWSSESETVVPTGAAFVDSNGPRAYAGHFVFCTFNSGMRVLTVGSSQATNGPGECKLDVKQGPDHALYYSDTQHIYRLG